MNQFLILLHEAADTFTGYSPEQYPALLQEYSAWAQQLAQDGHMLGGERLTRDSRRMRRVDDRIVTDGPFPETKEWMGGYFHIQAQDLAQAERLALQCPHLKHPHAWVEVRPVMARSEPQS